MRLAPIPLAAGRFKSAAYAGLGNACPDIAPYENLFYPGRCTNLTPDQQRAQQGGGSTSSPVPLSVSGPPASIVTDQAIVDQNNAARFGLNLTDDRATQERIAAEAIRQAQALGIPISCEVRPMLGLDYTAYGAVCSVNNDGEGHSAAALIRGDGWNIAAVESGLTASPNYVAAVLPAAPPAVASPPSSTTQSSSTPSVLEHPPTPAAAGSAFDPSAFVSQVATSAGLPSWALWAAACLAAVFVIGGKR